MRFSPTEDGGGEWLCGGGGGCGEVSVLGLGCSWRRSLSITTLLLSVSAWRSEDSASLWLVDTSETALSTDTVFELLFASSRLKKPVEVVLWNGVAVAADGMVELEVTCGRWSLLPAWGWATLGVRRPGVSLNCKCQCGKY